MACLLVALLGALAGAPAADARKGAKARSSRFDVDGDGRRNGRDRNVDGDRRRNVIDLDVDGDGRPNDYDHDIDADGVKNAFDADSDASGESFRASAATALAPPGFVGLVSDDAFWGTDADPSRAGTMAAIAGTGARVLRQSFYWSMIVPYIFVLLAGPLVYQGAFASGWREARWLGSRLWASTR